ncbi:MAG: flagellar basal-body rod protein FlgG [Candidatus Wallbacteria bacterium]
MINALWVGATGMNAQELNINVISNNLANVNTIGFKKSRAEFQDLIYSNLRSAGAPIAQGTTNPVGLEAGHGVKSVSTQKIFSQGDIVNTDNPLDLVIEGDGFFQVLLPDGSNGYTRDGAFRKDNNGILVSAAGYRLQPEITIPADATDITIGRDGQVSAMINGQNQSLGQQILIARFTNPAGLTSAGSNVFKESEASGAAIGPGVPGLESRGEILSNYTESSNVKAVEEIVKMIVAQRAYEMNSKTIQTTDQMLQTVGTLKRS